MSFRSSKIVYGMYAALVGAASLCGLASAQGGSMSDAQVEANVLRALAGAPQLATQSIKTTTVYGTVTLSGSVSDEATRVTAETLASKAPGVQKVVDELTVGDASIASANGSSSQQALAQSPQGDQGSTPQLQSDGTMAPAGNGQQNSNQSGQGTQDQAPEPGYVSPPAPGAGQSQQADAQQQQQANGQQEQADGQPQQMGGQPGYSQPYPGQNPGNGPGGPYRQPYYRNAPPQGYSQQPGMPPPGAQEAGKPVTIPVGALVRMRINEGLNSKRVQAGAIVDGTVLNDVVADGEVAIPRGATVQATLVESKNSGAVGGRGELALQLTNVTLSGKIFPIVSDTWTHEGQSKTGQTVGHAVGLGAFGALIGAVAGGGPGAAIGAVAGGAAGVGVSAASGRGQTVIPAEAILTFHLTQPAAVTTVSQAEMDRLAYGVQQSQLQRRPPPPPPGYYGRPVYYPYPY